MNDDDLRLELQALTDSLPPLGGLPLATATRIRRRRAVKLAGVGTVTGLVLLGGVALGAGLGGTDRLQPAPLADTSPSAAPSAAAPPAPSPVAPSPTGSAQVALGGDGLGLSAGGDRMLVIESSSAQQVRTALDGALGAGTDQALPDCGPSVVLRSYPGLQVVLQGDRFVGWSTRPGSTLQTVDGIGLGST
ncbi:MAG: hypothetical protein H7323_12810, partial [Frankiales bacterium]|nr:hypothetical protein [Frankiales bacterium]